MFAHSKLRLKVEKNLANSAEGGRYELCDILITVR